MIQSEEFRLADRGKENSLRAFWRHPTPNLFRAVCSSEPAYFGEFGFEAFVTFTIDVLRDQKILSNVVPHEESKEVLHLSHMLTRILTSFRRRTAPAEKDHLLYPSWV